MIPLMCKTNWGSSTVFLDFRLPTFNVCNKFLTMVWHKINQNIPCWKHRFPPQMKCNTRGGSRAAAASKMECFVTIVNGFQPLTIITKHSILNVAAALDSPLNTLMKITKKIELTKKNPIMSCRKISDYFCKERAANKSIWKMEKH